MNNLASISFAAPASTPIKKKGFPALWKSADLAFDENRQTWSFESSTDTDNWTVQIDQIRFQLKPTPVGHLGIFPEQQLNWRWIRDNLPRPTQAHGVPLKALNLFAYTGGTTMALAKQGIEVVHLDAAANTVKWARGNAAQSNLGDAPIRWIAEDAMRFLKREITRKNCYDIFVADPPTFGRGPKKEQWRIDRDLPEMLDLLPQLLPRPKAIVLSCHSDGYTSRWLKDAVRDSIDTSVGDLETLQLSLSTDHGHQLESGECVRWIANGAPNSAHPSRQ